MFLVTSCFPWRVGAVSVATAFAAMRQHRENVVIALKKWSMFLLHMFFLFCKSLGHNIIINLRYSLFLKEPFVTCLLLCVGVIY